jgi:molybdopterin-guanine dinucleotide biosynthesis protein A
VTGVILAGGQSQRMGKDKAFLEVAGQRIIDRTVRLFQQIFPHVMVITNTPVEYVYLGVRIATDLLPGCGALGGLHTALFLAESSHVFIAACDMPMVSLKVVEYLTGRGPRWDVVVPEIDGMLEPLHAVYSRRCLKPIEQILGHGGRKIVEFYPRVRVLRVPEEEVRVLDPQLRSFRNINTPEDLAVIEPRGARDCR